MLQRGKTVYWFQDAGVLDLVRVGVTVVLFCGGLEILLALGDLACVLRATAILLGHGWHVADILVGVGSVVRRGVIIIHNIIYSTHLHNNQKIDNLRNINKTISPNWDQAPPIPPQACPKLPHTSPHHH